MTSGVVSSLEKYASYNLYVRAVNVDESGNHIIGQQSNTFSITTKEDGTRACRLAFNYLMF